MSNPTLNLAHGGYTTIDLNDKSGYFVDMDGFNPGLAQTTWDEKVNALGVAVQTNVVVRRALVPVSIPMRAQGSSVADLNSKLSALWTMVNACTDASPGTLQLDSEAAYTIVYSTLPADLERDSDYQLGFRAYFTLVLMRRP